ncbi:MAG: hypothetical protein C5B46_08690 [Proteobacteria bacterium]|nr:MAG: hypothetical protein C5B46_08690 [Pseudomonadota bacterium]
MNPIFKIQRRMLDQIHTDLSRPHLFAAERVGFISCKVAAFDAGTVVALAQAYLPVRDDHYEDDPSVGAMLNGAAFRTALQHSYGSKTAMFHVHRHEHRGPPRFSHVDMGEARRFVPDFWKVQPSLPHGVIVLSRDRMHGLCWLPADRKPVPFATYTLVGFPTVIHHEVFK